MLDGVGQRILAIAGAKDRAAEVGDAADAFARERDEAAVGVFLR